MTIHTRPVAPLCGILLALIGSAASADEGPVAGGRTVTDNRSTDASPELLPLNPQGTVMLDRSGQRVLLRTKVVLQRGVLEMLVCLRQTKEHESILAINAEAYVIHAALLALGAVPGRPVQFAPEYHPPTGQRINVFVQWKDIRGRLQRLAAQQWIRHAVYRYYETPMANLPDDLRLPADDELRYDRYSKQLLWFGPMNLAKRDELLKLSRDTDYRKVIHGFFRQSRSRRMQAEWIFAGSGFHVDQDSGKRFYRAEGGDLICVANFPSATLDVAIESSAAGDTLMYEAWEERIPPAGTDVTVELIPVFTKKSAETPRAPATPVPEPAPTPDP